MKKLYFLSKKFNFKIIEDASHAFGSKINNNYIGSCKYSDLTVFSFHPVKMITTAEGGVVTTNNKKIADKLKVFREHGIIREKKNLKKNYKSRLIMNSTNLVIIIDCQIFMPYLETLS